MPSTCFKMREQLHYLFFPCSLLGRLHGVCFCAMTLLRTLTPPRQCYVLMLQLPVLGKNTILGGRCKPREQLHYLFFPCSPVGSPSCYLFLRYDIVAHPYSTAAVLHFDAAVALYCGKALFWADVVSQGNNCITCSFHVVLLGHLPVVCFCTMI